MNCTKGNYKIEEYGGLLLADIPDRFAPYEIGRDAF